MLLSWYALRGEALRPSPLHPSTRFYFLKASLATYTFSFFISIISYPCYLHSFLFSKSFLIALHARMTCTNHVRSVTSFNAVTWKTHVRIVKPLRLEKSALPLTFSHKHHGLFGFIVSLLISIATCAYVLLSWYALRGDAFIFKGFPCYLHPFLFS